MRGFKRWFARKGNIAGEHASHKNWGGTSTLMIDFFLPDYFFLMSLGHVSSGTTLPFIWPPPKHLQTPPPFKEPILPHPPSSTLLAREAELDAIRWVDIETVYWEGEELLGNTLIKYSSVSWSPTEYDSIVLRIGLVYNIIRTVLCFFFCIVIYWIVSLDCIAYSIVFPSSVFYSMV